MSSFVVVGRDVGDRSPTLAIGPLEGRELAESWREDLERRSVGLFVVLPLHTPTDGALGDAPAPEVDAEGLREVVVLTQSRHHEPSVYRRHVARGAVTLCGIELAGVTVPDPPDVGEPPGCGTCFARAELAGAGSLEP